MGQTHVLISLHLFYRILSGKRGYENHLLFPRVFRIHFSHHTYIVHFSIIIYESKSNLSCPLLSTAHRTLYSIRLHAIHPSRRCKEKRDLSMVYPRHSESPFSHHTCGDCVCPMETLGKSPLLLLVYGEM